MLSWSCLTSFKRKTLKNIRLIPRNLTAPRKEFKIIYKSTKISSKIHNASDEKIAMHGNRKIELIVRRKINK